MTVSQVAAAYADEREIVGRQRDELLALVRWFVEFVGSDIPASDVTSKHVFDFKTALFNKPTIRKKEDAGRTLPALIAAYDGADVARLAPKTVKKHIDHLHTVFGWAKRNRLIETNPAEGMSPPLPKAYHQRPPRLSFDDADIATMFSAPLFVGAKDETARQIGTQGDHLIADHRFWLPILALFTGCRLEEMGQADAADVKEAGGIWYFDVTTIGENDDSIDEAARKRLKTASSKRVIPLHPKLIEMGFIEYAESVAGGKLFPTLKPDKYGCRTASYSKHFGRWLSGVGITSSKKVFHSFRHRFKATARVFAGIPTAIHDYLTGHASGGSGFGAADDNHGSSVGAKYGIDIPFPLDLLANHVQRIQFPTFVTPPRRYWGGKGAVGSDAPAPTQTQTQPAPTPTGQKPKPKYGPRRRTSRRPPATDQPSAVGG